MTFPGESRGMSRRAVRIRDETLCRPNCGGDFLHHGIITVFHREDSREDSSRTLVTSIEGKVVASGIIPSEMSRNPGCRRDGLAIQFWCEGCAGQWELAIAQHKGQSHLGWRRAARNGGAV